MAESGQITRAFWGKPRIGTFAEFFFSRYSAIRLHPALPCELKGRKKNEQSWDMRSMSSINSRVYESSEPDSELKRVLKTTILYNSFLAANVFTAFICYSVRYV